MRLHAERCGLRRDLQRLLPSIRVQLPLTFCCACIWRRRRVVAGSYRRRGCRISGIHSYHGRCFVTNVRGIRSLARFEHRLQLRNARIFELLAPLHLSIDSFSGVCVRQILSEQERAADRLHEEIDSVVPQATLTALMLRCNCVLIVERGEKAFTRSFCMKNCSFRMNEDPRFSRAFVT